MSWAHKRAGIAGRRWERMRRFIFDRDGWRCRACGVAGRLEVDHVVPLERGGAAWDPGNMQAICKPCHYAKSARERGTVPLSPSRVARLRRIAGTIR